VTAKQRVVKNPGDQHEEGIDGYGVKDFKKRKVQDESGKRREKRQKSGWDQSLTMEKSWVIDDDDTPADQVSYDRPSVEYDRLFCFFAG